MVDTKVVLGLIRFDKQFRKGFMAKAREIYADIISFVANPNCTCKKRVEEYINNNLPAIDKYYQEWFVLTPKEVSDKLLEQIEEESKVKEVVKPVKEKDVKKGEPLPEEVPKKLKDAIFNKKQENINDVRGEVLEIAPDPMAYKEAILTGKKEGWDYTGLTVLETFKEVNGKEQAVWLVMFY